MSNTRALPPAEFLCLPALDQILAQRRTIRSFKAPSDTDLGNLLWHASRRLRSADSPMGFAIEQRPTPSAGAIHPVHILIELGAGLGWGRYDPSAHTLAVLDRVEARLTPLSALCETIVPREDGRLMLFVAEAGKTAAKYQHAESLIWRDAGVLQGTLALVASGLNMPFCLLGITGDPWAATLAQQGQLMGVGAAVIGAPA